MTGSALRPTALGNVWTIAQATFLEALRARVFVYLLVVAAAMIMGSVPTADLGIGEELRLVTDVAVAGSAYVCVFLAIFLGVSAVSGEVERRTVYTVIAKAASRSHFVVGKFFGVWLTVSVAVVMSYAMIIGLVSVLGQSLALHLLPALVMALLEMALLVAVATFFSCISKPLLSSGLTVGLYLIGVSLRSLYFWVERSKSDALVWMMKALYRLLPNFQIYDVRTEVVHKMDVSAASLAWTGAYTLLYAGALLTFASVIFHRRDLK